MVTSRQRSSIAASQKPQLEEWTTREKLCLASLAIKHGNSWNSVARHMQAFTEKDRPEGWSNQKTCAAQFDKMMNELGVDKRPKRNESSDATSSVIYKKMAERRMKELEEKTKEDRKAFLKLCQDLDAMNVDSKPTSEELLALTSSGDKPSAEKPELQLEQTTQLQTRQQRSKTAATVTPQSKIANTSLTRLSVSSESEKPSTRALTRRESSRQNLEKTLATLYKEALEIKALNQLCRPTADIERALGSYDKVVLKHVDMTTFKKRLGGEVDDPHAVMNDLLLMFQNATMYYPVDHPNYEIAVELRNRLVPQWERALLDRSQRSRH